MKPRHPWLSLHHANLSSCIESRATQSRKKHGLKRRRISELVPGLLTVSREVKTWIHATLSAKRVLRRTGRNL
jgi:hypothetical protein